MGKLSITSEALAKSAAKYRKELLTMPMLALEGQLKYMQPRTGITHSETLGELTGEGELGPYDPQRIDNSDLKVTPRVLEVHLGSMVREFDPNSAVGSVYAQSAVKGQAMTTDKLAQQVLSYLTVKSTDALARAVWKAVRNASGTKTIDLFDGFDTITKKELAAGNLATAKKNAYEIAAPITAVNAMDTLKALYRSASDMLRSRPTVMYLPQDVLDAYQDDYAATRGAVAYNQSFEQIYLEGSNGLCELVAMPSKAGSPYIHLTVKHNLTFGCGDGSSPDETIAVEKHSAFMLQYVRASFFGVQFQSISPEVLCVGYRSGNAPLMA